MKNLTKSKMKCVVVSRAEESEARVIRANSATHMLRCWHAALMAAYPFLKHRAQLDFKQNLLTEQMSEDLRVTRSMRGSSNYSSQVASPHTHTSTGTPRQGKMPSGYKTH